MLAPQLLGRLLNEVKTNENVRRLLKQCDEEGPVQNALLPTYHCMHTPGGPLKYVSIRYTLNQCILLTYKILKSIFQKTTSHVINFSPWRVISLPYLGSNLHQTFDML